MAKQRNSSVELLKIFGMFLIVLSHIALSMNGITDQDTSNLLFNVSYASRDINTIILRFFAYFGYVGNAMFFVSSSWFLCDVTKANKERIWQIITDVWTISVIIMLLYLVSPETVAIPYILQSLFPNILSNNWYITCYLIFYAIVPALNRILDTLEKEKYDKTVITLLLLYYGIGFVMPDNFQTNYLIMFLVIHAVIFYVKKYMGPVYRNDRISVLMFFVSLFCLSILIIVLNFAGLKIGLLESKMMRFANFQNPFIIAIALSLLLISINRSFTSKYINLVSSLSLFVYIIHENIIFRSYTRIHICESLLVKYDRNNVIVISLLLAVLLFLFSSVISFVYRKTIQHWTKKISVHISNCYDSFLSRIITAIGKMSGN